jgi:hypothetical protein
MNVHTLSTLPVQCRGAIHIIIAHSSSPCSPLEVQGLSTLANALLACSMQHEEHVCKGQGEGCTLSRIAHAHPTAILWSQYNLYHVRMAWQDQAIRKGIMLVASAAGSCLFLAHHVQLLTQRAELWHRGVLLCGQTHFYSIFIRRKERKASTLATCDA